MSGPDAASPAAPDAAEAALLAALRRGEDAAFETLVREYGGRLRQVARRILGNDDDANDALQDAFISAFKALDRFDGRSKLSTWLHRIVVNAALMKLRSRKRRPERSIDDLLPGFLDDGHRRIDPGTGWSATADALLSREETRRQVQAKIDELPEIHRTVLVLRDIEQMGTRETAEVLGIGEGAVKTRLHRARQALRTLLEEEFS